MDTPLPNWIPYDLKSQRDVEPGLDRETRPRVRILPSYPTYEFLLKEQSFIQTPSVSAQTPSNGFSDDFRVIYQHLHEKHYLDRVVRALYLYPDGHIGMSKNLSKNSRPSHIPFANVVRVVFPRPADLSDAINQARGNTRDPPLLSFLLAEPILRFRVCAIAHFFEAALAVPIGTWGSEHPRQLSGDEMSYVMEKLQGIFRDLLQQTPMRDCLVRALTYLSWWSGKRGAANEGEEEQGLPDITKAIFPCHDIVIQEYRNLLEVGKDDIVLDSEIKSLMDFVILALSATGTQNIPNWTHEGRIIFERLQKTLGTIKYRGPAQRLIRNIVSMADQLWEGGGASDTSLAIERILNTVIQKSYRGSDVMDGQGTGVGAGGGWNVMDDFERLVRAASSHVAPIPLPCIAWKRESLEIYLDSMVIDFPHLMPSNIHLDSTMEFDKHTNKSCCQWRLKILGLEIETKVAPYYFVAKVPLNRRLVDVGELSISIPADSLDIEIDFSLSTPNIRDKGSPSQRQPQSHRERNHSRTVSHKTRSLSNGMAITGSRGGSGNHESNHVETNGLSTLNIQSENTLSNLIREGWEEAKSANKNTGWTSTVDGIMQYPLKRQLPYGNGNENSTLRGLNQRGTEAAQERKKRLISTSTTARNAANSKLKKLLDVKNCTVRLRKLDVTVHKTKHPILYNFVHRVLVRQMQMALEQTLKQAIMDMVSAINIGANGIMGLENEGLESSHRDDDLTVSQQTTFTATSQQQQEWHQALLRQSESANDTNIYSAMPFDPNL